MQLGRVVCYQLLDRPGTVDCRRPDRRFPPTFKVVSAVGGPVALTLPASFFYI